MQITRKPFSLTKLQVNKIYRWKEFNEKVELFNMSKIDICTEKGLYS